MNALTGPRDYRKVKEDLKAAGYQGEKVILLVAADLGSFKALSDVAADMMTRVGMNVDYQALDIGTVLQRQIKKEPPDRSGWNAEAGATGGARIISPGPNDWLRCNGQQGFFGWPMSPEIESLRDQWFDAPDLPTQKKLAEAIQTQAFIDVPYYPLGIYYVPTAYRADLRGLLSGLPLFWNIRRDEPGPHQLLQRCLSADPWKQAGGPRTTVSGGLGRILGHCRPDRRACLSR